MPALTTIQLRRGTSAQWASSTNALAQGEMGYDTTIKKFKIGDGTSLWSSLPWANITGSDFVAGSGINLSYNSPSGSVTVSVSGLSSSSISDFNSSVSGLLPVKSITAGNNITITPSGDKNFVISSPVNSATVQDLIGSTIVAGSGIRTSYDSINKVETISVSGLNASYISDFNTTVSGLVNGIYAPLVNPALTGTPTVPTAAVDTNTNQIASTSFVLNQASSSTPLANGSAAVGISTRYARADHVHPTDSSRAALSGAVFTGSVSIPSGTGNFNTLTVNNTSVSVSGHTHTSANITDFNSAVSGLLNVKSLAQGSGIGIVNNAGVQTISVTGIPSSFITDLGNLATTQVIGRTGIALTYDSVSDIMYIDVSGVSFSGHKHVWGDITDASTKASLTELSYLSGVVPGSASASRALVVDSSKNLTGINSLITASDLTVGGNLTVQGTTTTVNSTTVNIGDNIIRVNTSGLNTGGLEVYTGSTTQSVLWNNTSNRWEFSGGNIYTSGSFIGSLSGNASTVTNGIYTTDVGTVTNSMLAGNIANSKLVNSSVTIGSTPVALGSTITSISGLSTVTSNTFVGSLSGTATNVITNANLTGPITSIGNATTISSGAIDNSHISSSAGISYSKLNLSNSITNNDISSSAAIAITKLASSGITIGSTFYSLGSTVSSLSGLTSIGGSSSSSPTTLSYCVIDGGTP